MKVGFIGAGNMARAIARGWGEPVLCSDGGSGRAAALAAELGGRAASNLEVAQESDLTILCHKPYQFDEVAQEIGPHVTAVASVLGSITAHMLQHAYAPAPVFRVMPNTPVEVRRGVVCYSPLEGIDEGVEGQVVELFGRLGSVITLPERLLEPATAIMGVGPAYQALLAEAQVDAGVRRGLAPGLASRLVVETMSGSAALLQARDYDTLTVRREVTSPGGSTARGLDALERAGVRSAFSDAMDAVEGPAR
ncbi:MAG: pyrroline-5-carboxylate reductase [Solirubrobacteraceae bacterium]|jgi:pyrroline-5-carboxylate reductase|nr:pyrroline-5-carboxylate reductase [Solirubrobacteraceae bacterium]